jgi:hypothetical protein
MELQKEQIKFIEDTETAKTDTERSLSHAELMLM